MNFDKIVYLNDTLKSLSISTTLPDIEKLTKLTELTNLDKLKVLINYTPYTNESSDMEEKLLRILESINCKTIDEVKEAALKIGYPVILRPAFGGLRRVPLREALWGTPALAFRRDSSQRQMGATRLPSGDSFSVSAAVCTGETGVPGGFSGCVPGGRDLPDGRRGYPCDDRRREFG